MFKILLCSSLCLGFGEALDCVWNTGILGPCLGLAGALESVWDLLGLLMVFDICLGSGMCLRFSGALVWDFLELLAMSGTFETFGPCLGLAGALEGVLGFM